VAPALARTHTVVCPDLRGYGGSFKPAPSGDHAAYSKRAMAGDMLALMDALGFATFALASHDRGARVAHRLALDAPERVAVLDIVPTLEQSERGHGVRAGVLPLVLVRAAAPQAGVRDQCGAGRMVQRAHLARPRLGQCGAGFLRARGEDGVPVGARPAHVRGRPVFDSAATLMAEKAHDPRMCEDDRAAVSIDLVHDRASRLDGAKGRIGGWYDPLALWREHCEAPVAGGAVASGHYLAEEAPAEVLGWLTPFLADAEQGRTRA